MLPPEYGDDDGDDGDDNGDDDDDDDYDDDGDDNGNDQLWYKYTSTYQVLVKKDTSRNFS